jgi:hypothetical protein
MVKRIPQAKRFLVDYGFSWASYNLTDLGELRELCVRLGTLLGCISSGNIAETIRLR